MANGQRASALGRKGKFKPRHYRVPGTCLGELGARTLSSSHSTSSPRSDSNCSMRRAIARPNIREFVTEQQSEIFLPAPFSPKLEPRQLGNLYEIRTYTLKPGGISGVIDRCSTQIAAPIKLSPLAFAGHSELGGLNRWCHIWAYKDAAERFAVREKARKDGIWPPRRGQPGQTLVQEKMLVVPAAFSPLHSA